METTWIAIAILAPLGFCVLINILVILSINKLEDAKNLLDVIDNGAERLRVNPDYATRQAWAEENGFEPDMMAEFHGTIGTGPITMAVWKNNYKKTYLSSYTAADKILCEFVTIFERDQGLTTSNTKDSVLFPPAPGHYLQSFDGMNIDGLFQKHEEALVHLVGQKHLQITERWESTDILILESIQRQVAHVKSNPFWQFLGVYWFFVRRNRMNNKSIAEQYP